MNQLFPALMKYWRGRRGLSQLDLALAADVSSRHISFLETGRSKPSPSMVVRLGATLGVPLRHVNSMLEAAGHDPVYDDGPGALPEPVREALDLLKKHQEPFPLMVMDRLYRLVDLNTAGRRLLEAMDVPAGEPNLAVMTFDPNVAQPYIANFDDVGRHFLWRLQREVLADPDDHEIRALLDQLLEMPTIDPSWRDVDFAQPSDPVMVIHLRKGPISFRFLTMVTAFQAPQNVAVESLRVESWFPYDAETEGFCRATATA